MKGAEVFLWGLFGGFGAEAASWFALRYQLPSAFPHWTKSVRYYILVVIMMLSGALVALAYSRSGTNLNPILAIQIGASTPLILRKFRDAVTEMPPPPDPGRIN